MTTPTKDDLMLETQNEALASGAENVGWVQVELLAQRLATTLAEGATKDEAITSMLEGRAQDDKEFQALHQRAEAAEAEVERLRDVERQLGDEAFHHAACLTIAEGWSGYGGDQWLTPIAEERPALTAVRKLRQRAEAAEVSRESETSTLRLQRDEALAAMASDGADACLDNARLRGENAALRARLLVVDERLLPEVERVLRILRGPPTRHQ